MDAEAGEAGELEGQGAGMRRLLAPGLHPRLSDVKCPPRSPFGSVLLRQDCAQGFAGAAAMLRQAQQERNQGLSTNRIKGSSINALGPTGGSCSAAVSRPKQVKQANSRERVQECGAC